MPELERDKVEGNPSADKVRERFFYGWVIAIASGSIIFATCNFQYSFGIFVKPLIDRFGWSRAAISGCVSVRTILGGLIAPVVGTLSDKYGPRKFMFAGILLAGIGYLLSSRITSLWQLYFFLSVLIGLAIGITYTPILALVTRWFGGKSALANGIVLSGYGLAQTVVPPAGTYLIIQYSWEVCFIILGLTAWVLGLLAWSFTKTPRKYSESLLVESARIGKPNQATETQNSVKGDYTLSEVLHTRAFWIVLLILMINALCFQMMIIHIIPAAIDAGIDAGAAAIILTLSGITNTVGRLGMGGLATRIGNKTVLAPSLVMQALALFVMAGATDLWVFYAAAAVHGLVYGGTSPIALTLGGSLFGIKSAGAIMGTLTLGYTVGVAVGPLLAGYIFDVTGSYYIAFFTAAITTAIAFLLCLLLKPPEKKVIAI